MESTWIDLTYKEYQHTQIRKETFCERAESLVSGYVRTVGESHSVLIPDSLDVVFLYFFYFHEAKQQRQLMQRIGLGTSVMAVGETWYPVAFEWYNSWKAYTMWNKGDADIDGGIDALNNLKAPRPDTINNLALQGLCRVDCCLLSVAQTVVPIQTLPIPLR